MIYRQYFDGHGMIGAVALSVAVPLSVVLQGAMARAAAEAVMRGAGRFDPVPFVLAWGGWMQAGLALVAAIGLCLVIVGREVESRER